MHLLLFNTYNFKKRTSNHISNIRCGRGGDFDEHVRNCAARYNKELIEPFFEARILMVLKDYMERNFMLRVMIS